MSEPEPQEGDYCVVPTKGFVEAHKPCLYFKRTAGKWKLVPPIPFVRLNSGVGGGVRISLPNKDQWNTFGPMDSLLEELKKFELLNSALYKLGKFVLLDVMWDQRVRLHGAAVRLLGEDKDDCRKDEAGCLPFYQSTDGMSVVITPHAYRTQGVVMIFVLYGWDSTGTQPNPTQVKKLICSVDPEIQSGVSLCDSP